MLEFGVSGKLINNALVMYDRQTDSLWSQFLSRAVEGEFTGTELEILPVNLTTWGQWSELNPETLALRKPSSTFDPYAGYYQDGSTGVLGQSNPDNRLEPKSLVMGLVFGSASKAYPLVEIDSARVINDVAGGEPVLIYRDSRSGFGLAYSREADGRTITFSMDPPDEFVIDEESGTRWDPITGAAVDGDLAGMSLERVHGMFVFWFAWTDFYPETELYGRPR